MQPWAWHVGIPIAGSSLSGLLFIVRAYYAAVGELNIYDVMFAQNVPVYMATEK